MCHLMAIPAGVPTSPKLIRAMENSGFSNPDGFGFAICNEAGDEMFVFRSMDLFEATEKFEEMRPQYMGDGLWHTRWGTHGETSIRNVHPFKVGKDKLTVLAHNGVLPSTTWPSKGDWRSDTNRFAKLFVPSWGTKLDGQRFQKHVEEFIGGNKVVFITVNPKYSKNLYIFGEQHGFWDPDTSCWHSNSDHLPTPQKYYGRSSSTMGYPRWWDDEDLEYCGPGCSNKSHGTGTEIDADVPSKNYKWASQRMLTEADVLAAHGYVPTNLEDVEVLEPCPNCGCFAGFDSTWQVCSECRMCGECNMSVATGDCSCYTPEWLRSRYEGSEPTDVMSGYDPDKYETGDWGRERPF